MAAPERSPSDAAHGYDDATGRAKAIDAVADGDVWRLAVDALVSSAVLETNLDHANDEVAIYTNTAKDGSGTDYQPIVDTDGHLQVDVLSTPSSAAAGDVAHDSADSGNPVKMGAKAIAYGTNPTDVTANDRTNLYANRAGILFTMGGHPNLVNFEYNTTAAQTNDGILAAISAGTKYGLTRLKVTASSANTAAVSYRIGWGAASLTAEGASGADAVTGIVDSHPGMVGGSISLTGDGSGLIGIGGDGEELRLTCSEPTTGKLTVTGTYFTIGS